MSALSSATRIRAPPRVHRTVRRHRRPGGRGRPRRPGRSASRAPPGRRPGRAGPVGSPDRPAARSAGGAPRPTGIATVNVVPRPERALHPHVAAFEAGQLADQGEPDAGALVAARPGALHPVEAFEEPGQILLGDADARVGDRQRDLARRRAVSPTRIRPTNVNFSAFDSRLRTIFPT